MAERLLKLRLQEADDVLIAGLLGIFLHAGVERGVDF